MGAGKQARLDRLARDFFQFSKEKAELEASAPNVYKTDIFYCQTVMDESIKQIEELDPPIGTDAYRALWESRGQRRIGC